MIVRQLKNPQQFLDALLMLKEDNIQFSPFIMRNYDDGSLNYSTNILNSERLDLNIQLLPTLEHVSFEKKKNDGKYHGKIFGTAEQVLEGNHFQDSWQKVLDERIPSLRVHQQNQSSERASEGYRSAVQKIDYEVIRIPLETDSRAINQETDAELLRQRENMTKCALVVRPLASPIVYPPVRGEVGDTKYRGLDFKIEVEYEPSFDKASFEKSLKNLGFTILEGTLYLSDREG